MKQDMRSVWDHSIAPRQEGMRFAEHDLIASRVSKLKAIKVELQRRMHDRNADVGAWLRKVVLGYYQYHAVPGNTTQLRIFKLRVCRLWRSVLVRRSQRAKMCWERFTPVLNRWIPPPRVLHPYPDARFYATHPS
jgi:RNA-directed DNA polymerase